MLILIKYRWFPQSKDCDLGRTGHILHMGRGSQISVSTANISCCLSHEMCMHMLCMCWLHCLYIRPALGLQLVLTSRVQDSLAPGLAPHTSRLCFPQQHPTQADIYHSIQVGPHPEVDPHPDASSCLGA